MTSCRSASVAAVGSRTRRQIGGRKRDSDGLGSLVPAGQLGAGLRAPAANWRPWLALAAAHLMAYGDTLVRDAMLV
jgi:hypothetical protein